MLTPSPCSQTAVGACLVAGLVRSEEVSLLAFGVLGLGELGRIEGVAIVRVYGFLFTGSFKGTLKAYRGLEFRLITPRVQARAVESLHPEP